MKNFKAVLFDFDGVLANTIGDILLSWKFAFKTFGVDIKDEDYLPLEGMNVHKIAETISKKYGFNIDPKKLLKIKNKHYLENHSFSFYPKVSKLIDFLRKKGKKLAIVSASPREKLEKTVPKEFLKKFNIVISGDDTSEGKPNPEPYLVAMTKLNVSPEESVVIENAPLGVKSAKAAGAYCIALTTTLGKEYLKEADEIVKNIKELNKKLFF